MQTNGDICFNVSRMRRGRLSTAVLFFIVSLLIAPAIYFCVVWRGWAKGDVLVEKSSSEFSEKPRKFVISRAPVNVGPLSFIGDTSPYEYQFKVEEGEAQFASK